MMQRHDRDSLQTAAERMLAFIVEEGNDVQLCTVTQMLIRTAQEVEERQALMGYEPTLAACEAVPSPSAPVETNGRVGEYPRHG